MRRTRRRRCLCCGELFRPDPRNRARQRFCTKSGCRSASKAASQRRWLQKPENRKYFCGSAHVERVRAWRARCRPPAPDSSKQLRPLQDWSRAQTSEKTSEALTVTLQDIFHSPTALLAGLVAHITGSRVQEVILTTSRRLVQVGKEILDG